MNIEVEKAKAFEIDPSKEYLVTFESEVPIPMEEAERIKNSLVKLFSKAGARAQAVITVKGSIKIAEIKK